MPEKEIVELEDKLTEVQKNSEHWYRKYKKLQKELEQAKEIIGEYIRLSLQEDKDMIANIELFKRAEQFLREMEV